MNLGQLGHLISENMAGFMPLSPEQHHNAFVSASFLHLIQLLNSFDLNQETGWVDWFVREDRNHLQKSSKHAGLMHDGWFAYIYLA